MKNNAQNSQGAKRPRAIKLVVGLVLSVALLSALWVYLGEKGPDPKKYAHLKEPRLTEMGPMPMIVISAKGDPSKTAGRAMGFLYNACHKIKGCVRDAPPRARWPEGLSVPREEWTGRFALPVTAERPGVAGIDLPAGYAISLETWTYGEVAEILHAGPYSKEAPTVEKLKAFIEKEGRVIAGDHEEEYVKGPGWFFKGDPDGYLTVIRYPVKKKN